MCPRNASQDSDHSRIGPQTRQARTAFRVLSALLQGALKIGYAWHHALTVIDADSEEGVTPIWRVRAWRWGCLLYLFGSALQFFSTAFAAQTLLLAVSSVQFATHLLSSWLLEGATIPRRSVLAAGVVIASNILLVIFSSKRSALLDAAELVALHRCVARRSAR